MALLRIKGVGENKVEHYGELFLEEIKKYVDENEEKPSSKTPSHILTYELYKDGFTLDEIAKQREVKIITIQNHIIQCATEGLDVDLDALIPKEYENLILEAINEVGSEKLKPIKEMLPDEVDYLAIKAVIAKNS